MKKGRPRFLLGPLCVRFSKKRSSLLSIFLDRRCMSKSRPAVGPLVSNSKEKPNVDRLCGDVRASGPCVKFYPPVSKCQIMAGPGAPTIPALSSAVCLLRDRVEFESEATGARMERCCWKDV